MNLEIDEVAVERACQGDRSVTLNRAEVAAALTWFQQTGVSLRETARLLGFTDRTVERVRAGTMNPPRTRPGRPRGSSAASQTPRCATGETTRKAAAK